MKTRWSLGMTIVLMLAPGSMGAGIAPPEKAPSDQKAPAKPTPLDTIKKLAGEWESKDDTGKAMLASVFRVTAAGSAVTETMLPGSDHEMINMYHMDGDALVVTHYCAAGNQPTMKAAPAKAGEPITFNMTHVSNLTNPAGPYMGSFTIVFVDDDHIKQIWSHIQDGKKGEDVTFELSRRKTGGAH